ncbi:hypothetical protein D3C85_1379910 [compost metagenome]
MPDIVQQVQGHGTTDRIDGKSEVIHSVGTAGDNVERLIELNLSALSIGRLRIDRVEAARHVATAQCQAVTDITCPIRPEGMTELGLHRSGRQSGTRNTIATHTAQCGQALIHHHGPQTRRLNS